MNICVIGSMRDFGRIQQIANDLQQRGNHVTLPIDTSEARFADARMAKKEFMKGMYEQVKLCDSVLVVNDSPRDGYDNYIGPNTFLTMGMAMALGKDVFALGQWDPKLPYNEELEAMGVNVIDIQKRF
jgi:nucleoside 2-deoxyribosyltransferase